MPIIAANFKTNHTRKSSAKYISLLSQYLKTNSTTHVYVFPSYTSLDEYETLANLTIGAQNAYPTQTGSITGEIGALHLEEFNIKTLLIGHSERRHILGETQTHTAQKFEYFKNLGYKIIYCIGEPLEVKEQGLEATLRFLHAQFEGIDLEYENCIIAYEPVWAIGTGKSATIEDIKNVHNEIKKTIKQPLLYGGSVNSENIETICALDNVDGALIGSASLEVENFIKMIENTKEL